MNLSNFGIDQSYVQRYIIAKSDREARKSLWLGALLYLPVSAMFFFIGTALFAYYQAQPGLLPGELHDPKMADRVFPYFIVHGLPAGFTGLVIAAIFAAAMSSVDSSLNCSATLTLADLYKRHVRRDAGERESMWVLRVSTVFWGILGTAIGLALAVLAADESTLDVWWKLSGIFSGGMLGIFLLGLVSRRATSAAALVGAAVGIILILWMTVSPTWQAFPEGLRSPFHSFLIPAFGSMAIILVGFAATWLVKGERR
jgi:SSS family solute:Na+ symporter